MRPEKRRDTNVDILAGDGGGQVFFFFFFFFLDPPQATTDGPGGPCRPPRRELLTDGA